MTINQDEILRNIQARKHAEEICELASIDASELPEESRERFWETLAIYAAKEHSKYRRACIPPIAAGPMSDEEAIVFEREVVPFGIHAGHRVGDVPFDYWLVITESKFNRQLNRYIKSDYFQRRQESE